MDVCGKHGKGDTDRGVGLRQRYVTNESQGMQDELHIHDRGVQYGFVWKTQDTKDHKRKWSEI